MQPMMAPGPVEYKRKYTLWVLVVLILFCWPAAIIYYFTRDKVPVQELHTYAMPAQAAPAYGAPPQTGYEAPANPYGGDQAAPPRGGRPPPGGSPPSV